MENGPTVAKSPSKTPTVDIITAVRIKKGGIKAVELSDQDHGHDEKSDAKGLRQKRAGFFLFLVLALEGHRDARIQLGLVGHPSLDLGHLVVGEQALFHIGFHVHDATPIDAQNGPYPRPRLARHEVADGHLAEFPLDSRMRSSCLMVRYFSG